jgi:ketosteroid isomerase-like protein
MTEAEVLVARLEQATNEHDLDALVACFAEDYENETPAHPARGFRGREQVRRNWEQVFAFVPDLRAIVVASAFDGQTAWTEWEMHGTRRDGTPHRMAGVIVFAVERGVAQRARFFLEPIDEDAGTVDDAVRRQVVR